MSVCVSTRKLSYFPSEDFSETWQLFRDQYSKKNVRARFSKKNPVSYKKIDLCFFEYLKFCYVKTTLTILFKSSEMVDWKVRNNS